MNFPHIAYSLLEGFANFDRPTLTSGPVSKLCKCLAFNFSGPIFCISCFIIRSSFSAFPCISFSLAYSGMDTATPAPREIGGNYFHSLQIGSTHIKFVVKPTTWPMHGQILSGPHWVPNKVCRIRSCN